MIPINELQQGVCQLVGMERARELVAEAVTTLGLPLKPGYPKSEFRQICGQLKQQGGMISVVVSAVAVQLIMSGSSVG